MLVPDVPDELHDHEGLADSGPAEDRGLAALLERADEVDDLDAGLEDLGGRRLVHERWRRAMDGVAAHALHRPLAVDRIAGDVEEATERRGTDRHRDRLPGREHLHAAPQAVARVHRDGADPVVAQVLLDLGHELALVVARDPERLVDLGQVTFLERHVQHRPDDLDDVAEVLFLRFGDLFRGLDGHVSYPFESASAPEAISSISFVMRACRALFAARARSSMRSPAASVALRIATI